VKKCFHLLRDAGCDINAVDIDGKTPLHYSVSGSQVGGTYTKCGSTLYQVAIGKWCRSHE
jgi:hypothetical protein